MKKLAIVLALLVLIPLATADEQLIIPGIGDPQMWGQEGGDEQLGVFIVDQIPVVPGGAGGGGGTLKDEEEEILVEEIEKEGLIFSLLPESMKNLGFSEESFIIFILSLLSVLILLYILVKRDKKKKKKRRILRSGGK